MAAKKILEGKNFILKLKKNYFLVKSLYQNVRHVWVYDTNDILSTNTHIAFTKNAVDKIRRKKMEKRT